MSSIVNRSAVILRLTKLAILFFLFLLAGCTPGAINLNQGIEHFKAQDYRTAFIRLKPEAEKGQPDAQYAIGYMYYYGQGVVEDRKQAWFWITKAAQHGQKDAEIALRILDQGARAAQKTFESKNLEHFPADTHVY